MDQMLAILAQNGVLGIVAAVLIFAVQYLYKQMSDTQKARIDDLSKFSTTLVDELTKANESFKKVADLITKTGSSADLQNQTLINQLNNIKELISSLKDILNKK